MAWLWRLLEALNTIASAHFGTLTQDLVGSPHTSRILEPRPKVLIYSALNCRECKHRTISNLSLSPLFSVLFFSTIIRNWVSTFFPVFHHMQSQFYSMFFPQLIHIITFTSCYNTLNCRKCKHRTISHLSLSPLFSVLFFSPIIWNSISTFSPSSTICSSNFTACFSPI